VEIQGQQGNSTLTRRPATYHGNWIRRAQRSVDDLPRSSCAGTNSVQVTVQRRELGRGADISWSRTDRNSGLVADSAWARTCTDSALGQSAAADRTRTKLRNGRERGFCTDTDKMRARTGRGCGQCAGHSRESARTLPGYCPVDARTNCQKLRGQFIGHHAGHPAGRCADIVRLAALPSSKGMVSNQNDRLSRFRKPAKHTFG